MNEEDIKYYAYKLYELKHGETLDEYWVRFQKWKKNILINFPRIWADDPDLDESEIYLEEFHEWLKDKENVRRIGINEPETEPVFIPKLKFTEDGYRVVTDDEFRKD